MVGPLGPVGMTWAETAGTARRARTEAHMLHREQLVVKKEDENEKRDESVQGVSRSGRVLWEEGARLASGYIDVVRRRLAAGSRASVVLSSEGIRSLLRCTADARQSVRGKGCGRGERREVRGESSIRLGWDSLSDPRSPSILSYSVSGACEFVQCVRGCGDPPWILSFALALSWLPGHVSVLSLARPCLASWLRFRQCNVFVLSSGWRLGMFARFGRRADSRCQTPGCGPGIPGASAGRARASTYS